MKFIKITFLASVFIFAVASLHGEEVKYSVYHLDQNHLAFEARNDSEVLMYLSAGFFKRTYPVLLNMSFRDFKTKEPILIFGRNVESSPDNISASLNTNASERLLELPLGTKILRSVDKKHLVSLGVFNLRVFYKDKTAFWDLLESRIAAGEVEFRLSFPESYEKIRKDRWIHTQWITMKSIDTRD